LASYGLGVVYKLDGVEVDKNLAVGCDDIYHIIPQARESSGGDRVLMNVILVLWFEAGIRIQSSLPSEEGHRVHT